MEQAAEFYNPLALWALTHSSRVCIQIPKQRDNVGTTERVNHLHH